VHHCIASGGWRKLEQGARFGAGGDVAAQGAGVGGDAFDEAGVGGGVAFFGIHEESVFEAGADVAAGFDGEALDIELKAADAGGGPDGVGGKALEHEGEIGGRRGEGAAAAQEDVDVERAVGGQQVVLEKVAGVFGHAGLEDFKFGKDVAFLHAFGEGVDHVRGIDGGVPGEVHGAQGEAGHFGAGAVGVCRQVENGRAFLEGAVDAAAGGDAENGVGAGVADALEDLAVDVRAWSGAAVGVACVEVEDACARGDAAAGVGGNFGRSDGKGAVVGFRRDHAGKRGIDDEFVRHAERFLTTERGGC